MKFKKLIMIFVKRENLYDYEDDMFVEMSIKKLILKSKLVTKFKIYEP